MMGRMSDSKKCPNRPDSFHGFVTWSPSPTEIFRTPFDIIWSARMLSSFPSLHPPPP